MKLLADKDERFKRLFTKISIFLLIALVGVSLNLLFAAVKKGLFTPKSVVYFVADSGQDLKVGMPVKLSGFKIGSVSKLDLNDKAQAQGEMMIETGYLPLLRTDAVVSLKKEGVIGDGILEARRGSDDKPQLKAGASIDFERGGGLEQIANDLRDRLYPALDEINKLLKNVNDPKGDVRQTLGNLNKFSAELRGTRERIDHLLGEIDDGVVNDVRPALRSLKGSVAGVETIIGKLNNDLPGMMDKADASMENLRKSSATIKSALDNSAPQLTGLMGETRGLMSDTRNIMDSASKSWPLKNMMAPQEKGLIKMDSHD